jgi:hypothetical protein
LLQKEPRVFILWLCVKQLIKNHGGEMLGEKRYCVCLTVKPLSSFRQLFCITLSYCKRKYMYKQDLSCTPLPFSFDSKYTWSTVPGGVRDVSPLCGIRGPGANPLGVSVPRTVLYSEQIKEIKMVLRHNGGVCDICMTKRILLLQA